MTKCCRSCVDELQLASYAVTLVVAFAIILMNCRKCFGGGGGGGGGIRNS